MLLTVRDRSIPINLGSEPVSMSGSIDRFRFSKIGDFGGLGDVTRSIQNSSDISFCARKFIHTQYGHLFHSMCQQRVWGIAGEKLLTQSRTHQTITVYGFPRHLLSLWSNVRLVGGCFSFTADCKWRAWKCSYQMYHMGWGPKTSYLHHLIINHQLHPLSTPAFPCVIWTVALVQVTLTLVILG